MTQSAISIRCEIPLWAQSAERRSETTRARAALTQSSDGKNQVKLIFDMTEKKRKKKWNPYFKTAPTKTTTMTEAFWHIKNHRSEPTDDDDDDSSAAARKAHGKTQMRYTAVAWRKSQYFDYTLHYECCCCCRMLVKQMPKHSTCCSILIHTQKKAEMEFSTYRNGREEKNPKESSNGKINRKRVVVG